MKILSKYCPSWDHRLLEVTCRCNYPSCKGDLAMSFHHNLKPTEFNHPLFCIHPLPHLHPQTTQLFVSKILDFPKQMPPNPLQREEHRSLLHSWKGGGKPRWQSCFSSFSGSCRKPPGCPAIDGEPQVWIGGLCEPLSQREWINQPATHFVLWMKLGLPQAAGSILRVSASCRLCCVLAGGDRECC